MKDTLRELERMGSDALAFAMTFAQFRGKVLAHAGHEEVDEFSRLRESVPAERLHALVPMLKAAEAVAPTHPHPGCRVRGRELRGRSGAVVVRPHQGPRAQGHRRPPGG